MSQSPQSIANGTGAAVRAAINTAFAALFSTNSGSTAPSTTVAHMFWADTATGVLWKRNAANTLWLNYGTIDETYVLSRSSNTMLDVSDKGKAIIGTSTFSQTFDTGANLKDGWFIFYKNAGSGNITLTPGSGTIDGAATLVLLPGQSVSIWCNGTNLFTAGQVDLTGYAQLDATQAWTKAQRGAQYSLTQAATIAVDFSLSNNFYTQMTGNRTLGNPTNAGVGQSGIIRIDQDATGGRTLAFGSNWKFPGGVAPVLSTSANSIDALAYYAISPTFIIASLTKQYS